MREYLRLFFLFTMAKTFEKQYIEMKDISEKKKKTKKWRRNRTKKNERRGKKIGEQVGSVRGERGMQGEESTSSCWSFGVVSTS